MTKTKYSVPRIQSSIKRLVRKRDKLNFRARKSSSPDKENHYKRFRAHVQKSIRDAYWKHVTNIFSFENDNPDPDWIRLLFVIDSFSQPSLANQMMKCPPKAQVLSPLWVKLLLTQRGH